MLFAEKCPEAAPLVDCVRRLDSLLSAEKWSTAPLPGGVHSGPLSI